MIKKSREHISSYLKILMSFWKFKYKFLYPAVYCLHVMIGAKNYLCIDIYVFNKNMILHFKRFFARVKWSLAISLHLLSVYH